MYVGDVCCHSYAQEGVPRFSETSVLPKLRYRSVSEMIAMASAQLKAALGLPDDCEDDVSLNYTGN